MRRSLIGALVVLAILAGTAMAAQRPITGFGATTAAWNRAHTADPRFAPGAAYNPDPALRGEDHYRGVLHQDGHVTLYDYAFTGRSIASARALVLRTEFPPDVRVVWFVAKGSCALMLVRSAALARAIGRGPIGDAKGTSLIGFSSGVAADTYNPRSVNLASLSLYGLTPRSQAPPC